MSNSSPELVILFEHPDWQEPLFETLTRRGVSFQPLDLKTATLSDRDSPLARLYFNQASPSAYLRGNTGSVPLALAMIEDLEARGVRVLNGSRAFRLELSKMAQISLMRNLGICYPRTWAFSDVSSLHERRREIVFPALLKPNQGGSGARMAKIESLDELTALLEDNPELWQPDNLLLLQELLAYDRSQGIVRMEYLDGELLYAIRVIAGDSFNLCPSEICNPGHPGPTVSGTGAAVSEVEGPQFIPFPEVPQEAVETGRRLFQTAQLDVGAVEYLETEDGRLVFYDINANSNLRRSMGEELGFDPFERVADYLISELRREFFRDPALKKGRVSVFQ